MDENTSKSEELQENNIKTAPESKTAKKGKRSFKKVIAFILVGILCFGGGFLTDRLATQSRLRKGFNRNGNFRQFNRTPAKNTAPNGQSNQ